MALPRTRFSRLCDHSGGVLPHSATTLPFGEPVSPSTMHGRRLVILVNESKHFLSHRLAAAQAAVEDGFDVHLITRVMHDSAMIERYGIHVHDIEFPRSLSNPVVELKTLRRLLRLYSELQPDLLHHFSAKAILLGSLAAHGVRASHVVNTFTGLGAAFTGQGLKAATRRVLATWCLKRLLRPRGWRVTFQNQEDMQQLVDAGIVRASQCQVISGSGVDTSEFRPVGEPTGLPIIMLASRMIWAKGIAEFVAAASLLKETEVPARFVLVGDTDPGSTTAVPVEQLRKWDAEGTVEWWGQCHDMPATLGQASVVVLPTYYGEGLPKVLLESAACGKSIIATDVRGCREIVRHDENGLLVSAHDVEGLASAMWQLIHQPGRRAQMGLRGREIVQRQFTAQQVADRTVSIYRDLLGMPPASKPAPLSHTQDLAQNALQRSV